MLHTAKFVHTHGGQTEIILRVKQGDNPTFGFLMPGDPLHPFFRYMVENYEQLVEAMQMQAGQAPGGVSEVLGFKGGSGEGFGGGKVDAVSLVAAAYGEDEEEGGDVGMEPGGRSSAENESGEVLGGREASVDWAGPSGSMGEGDADGGKLDGRAEGTAGGGVSKAEAESDAGKEEALSEAPQLSEVEEEPLSKAPQHSKIEEEDSSIVPDETISAPLEEHRIVEGPALPAVRFAIAKNPPLAALRRIKREGSASEKQSGADSAGQGKERGKLDVEGSSGRPETAEEIADSGRTMEPHSDEDQALELKSKEVSPAYVKEPPVSSVNERLESSVNERLQSSVNEPLMPSMAEPLLSNEPAAPSVNAPPLQTKRVIDKMVEFIARNGRHFEEAVRRKDEAERRFLFLVQGDPHHAYYAYQLDRALMEKVRKALSNGCDGCARRSLTHIVRQSCNW
jgi:hypothetical protein